MGFYLTWLTRGDSRTAVDAAATIFQSATANGTRGVGFNADATNGGLNEAAFATLKETQFRFFQTASNDFGVSRSLAH